MPIEILLPAIIGKLQFPQITVVGIKKPNQEMQINPPPDAVILEKDILVLVGSSDELERLTREMSNDS